MKDPWSTIMQELLREIRSVIKTRAHRLKLNDPGLVVFWEQYLIALKKLRAQLRFYMPLKKPAAWLEEMGYPAHDPIEWCDFVPPHVKQVFQEEQTALSNFDRTRKQVFAPPKPLRGILTYEKRYTDIANELREVQHNNDLLRATRVEAGSSTEWEDHRDWQLSLARERLATYTPTGKALPRDWTLLLSPEERAMPIDDTPRAYDVSNAVPARKQDDPKPKGRPKGAKDKKPRKHAPLSPLALSQRRRRHAMREHQAELAAQRRMGIDPYKPTEE